MFRDARLPHDVVPATRRSSGVAPRTGVRVYARAEYLHTYIHTTYASYTSAVASSPPRLLPARRVNPSSVAAEEPDREYTMRDSYAT